MTITEHDPANLRYGASYLAVAGGSSAVTASGRKHLADDVLACLRLLWVSASLLVAHLEVWTYRIGIFVALNVLDDPAWLAMIFC